MSSSIFFRFKSRKDALQINFDGTSLSVFEVKREIMSIARLGDGKDFDLDIYTSDTNEVYDDDTTQIPRSTTVIVRRQPAQRPGGGRAARYLTGQMPLHARNQHRIEPSSKQISGKSASAAAHGGVEDGTAMTEEERLLAIMSASNTQLKADLEMSASKPVMRPTFNKSAAVPDKPLPPSYVCHRCGEKGHWIQACPTNNDPNYDGKHKFKRTTGIPRSMLEIVEKPEGVDGDGKIDPSKLDKGLMYTTSGEWVRARPDQATWQKYQEQQSASAERAKEAALGDDELRERGLECPIDKRAFVEPVKTPCCGRTYCRDCIETALLDSDLTCPNCGEQVLLDHLEADDATAKKLEQFETEKKSEKHSQEEKDAAKSPTPTASPPRERSAGVGEDHERSTSQSANETAAVGSPQTVASNPRKRHAESELENNRQPKHPVPSKPSQSQQGTPRPSSSQSATPLPQPPLPQPPRAPKSMMDFVSQMNAMAGGMPAVPNNNPMDGFNPMMQGMPMGMPMGMNMPNMPSMPNMPNAPNMPMGIHMGMPMGMNPMMNGGVMSNFGMGNGMDGMNGMHGMHGMHGMNGMGGMSGLHGMNGMNGQGFPGMNGMDGGMGWQNQAHQPWANGMMADNNPSGNGDGAYFRQPVNPHRHQSKQRRPRSVDYKQM